jgi:uncharacterized membrane protein YeaQ/YmgE (transglycosylase-associated protein family)
VSFLAWIVLGSIAGFASSGLDDEQGEGSLSMRHSGVVGAIVGGLIFGLLGPASVIDFDLYSVFAAGVGPIVVVTAYHLLFARRASTSGASAFASSDIRGARVRQEKIRWQPVARRIRSRDA